MQFSSIGETMTYKSWVVRLLLSLFFLILSIGAFNYWIDPLWMFSSSHEYNDVQDTFNERQQKTNRVFYQPFSPDTLLIGSSRSTYINPHEFYDMDVYNYSVANMSVQEYESYIQFAKVHSEKKIDTVILGLDFFKSSLDQSNVKMTIEPYTKNLNKPFHRWTSNLSYDTMKYSYYNLKASIKDQPVFVRSYDRDNVATTTILPIEEANQELAKKIIKFKSTFYGNYQYNPEYKNVLQNVRNQNPDTTFIVFTTPISEPLFQALIDSGRFPDYEKWLREMVGVYGGVYNFMDLNTVTKDTSNYFDGHHFYPNVGTLIAHRLSGEAASNIPNDFGVYLTEDNIDKYLEDFRKQIN
jgi:hypothetical protein